MKRIVFIALLILGAQGLISAQGYITAIGLRYSGSSTVSNLGITLQQRIAPNITIEAITEWRQKEPILTLLAQYHQSLLFKGFNVYAGIGGHTNLADLEVSDNLNNFKYGMNGVLGAELRLPFFPLVISADIMPELNKIKDPVDLKEWDVKASTNISVRYVVYSDKMKRKRLKKKKKKERIEEKADKQEAREKDKVNQLKTKEKEKAEQEKAKAKEKAAQEKSKVKEKVEEEKVGKKIKNTAKDWWNNLKNKLPKVGKKEGS